MTNKPKLSVERELLERVADNRYRDKERISIARHEALWELRGLLDKQSCGACNGCANGCTLDRESPQVEPAAPHKGEPVAKAKPVAKLHAERLTGRDGEYGVTVEDSEWFNTCRLTGGIFNLYAEQPAPVAVELPERSSQDYAIEHAEYMAQSADDVLAKFQAYGLALLAIDEGGDDGEGELFEAIDTARGDLQESLVDLRGMVYEFRKRSSRCTSL